MTFQEARESQRCLEFRQRGRGGERERERATTLAIALTKERKTHTHTQARTNTHTHTHTETDRYIYIYILLLLLLLLLYVYTHIYIYICRYTSLRFWRLETCTSNRKSDVTKPGAKCLLHASCCPNKTLGAKKCPSRTCGPNLSCSWCASCAYCCRHRPMVAMPATVIVSSRFYLEQVFPLCIESFILVVTPVSEAFLAPDSDAARRGGR